MVIKMVEYALVNIAQYALIFDDNDKFLILQFEKSNFPTHSEKWILPGGRLNAGESNLIEALKREIKEESGLEVDVLFPFIAELGDHSGNLCCKIGYICRYISGIVSVNADGLANYKWVDYDQVNDYDFIGDKLFKRFIEASKK
ncbi:MAG: NUDIX hydrolase [Candidatus Woesearchaeota archaeon]